MTGSLKDLIKIKRHFNNLLIFIYMWIASSFNIYLVTYAMKYIPGNIYHNSLVSAVTDLPLAIIGGIVYHKLGARFTLTAAFILAIVGSVSILIAGNSHPDLVPIMLSFARGGVKVTFDVCYLANSTIFPAIFAGTAFGICNIGAKVATILSPMLAEVEAPTPMIVFTATATVAIVLSQFIRTPHNKH